jgi:DNA-directed RNA polymerase subunit RPC12/RpoP
MAEDQATTYACRSCGADLAFDPASGALKCGHCSVETDVALAGAPLEELDFEEFLKKAEQAEARETRLTVKCKSCGAETTLEDNSTAGRCAFCGSNIVAKTQSTQTIKPRWLLPFKVRRQQSLRNFKSWLNRLWFAPTKLRRMARAEGLTGVYVPYWTYDCRATTHYTGQRGEHYWDHRTVYRTENGRRVSRRERVRRTRWYNTSGVVGSHFDDVLVLGSRSLPRRQADALEPWDLRNLVPYTEDCLAGFRAESYTLGLSDGFTEAQKKMIPQIRKTVERDIGGDQQRIGGLKTHYGDIKFKHLLLPLWITAFKFQGKVYRVVVNGRTGEVQGERPWSWVKIALAATAVVSVIAGIVYLAS